MLTRHAGTLGVFPSTTETAHGDKSLQAQISVVEAGKLVVQGYPWLHSESEAGLVCMRLCHRLRGCYKKQGMLDLFYKLRAERLWFPVGDGDAKRRTKSGGQTRTRWCIDVKLPVEDSRRFPCRILALNRTVVACELTVILHTLAQPAGAYCNLACLFLLSLL